MNFPLLILLIPFLFLLAINAKERTTKPSYTKGDYKWIESYVNKFEPGKRCPCGKDDLSEMILAYFQWVHPETQKMQLARYLISEELLGDGGVGVVYHGTMISYQENKPHVCVAIKMAIDGANIDVNRSTDIMQREINVMESFRMTNLNHIIGYGPRHYNIRFEERPPELAIAIVMQIGQSFQNYWRTAKKYSEEIMLKILKQILIGIEEIHQKDFIHLDLKIDNIVKMPSINDNDEILKLIDFGGAIEVENVDNVTSFNMNPEFAAPEITVPKFFEEDNTTKIVVSKKADIWSFGMLILSLLIYTPTLNGIGNPIGFFVNAELIQLKTHEELKKKFEEELSEFLSISKKNYQKISAILESCLKWKPEERPNAEELLKGEYLKDISTPTENVDFFGEITNYLDEQFKEISKYLKSKKFTKRLLHPLVRFKHKVSKFKILNRKKQQSQNHHFVEENIHTVSKGKAQYYETKLLAQGENTEGHHVQQNQMEGQSSKHGIYENKTSSDSDQMAMNSSSNSASFHSARHYFEHLEENSPHSTPFYTAPSSPAEREIHSSSSTNESEIQLADESEKSVDFGKNILSSTELSAAHLNKEEIASKKKSCCDHFIVFLKKAAKFCGNCLLGPANYDDELKKKAKKEVQKN